MMMPEEWPIAAPPADAAAPARAAGRDRLHTARIDFFLDPAERLTEQERALMTAMLHCLISDVATDLRAALPIGWAVANDDEPGLVGDLTRAQLLDEPELIAALLRRAEDEGIGSAARARSGRREARVLQGLVGHGSTDVSAAAMALILGRGRRRNRFGQCMLAFDDVPPATADHLVNAVAAALRRELQASRDGVDGELGNAAISVLAHHDPAKSIDQLTYRLVAALADVEGLDDELLLAAAHDGEISFIAQAAGICAGLPGSVAADEIFSGNVDRIVRMMKVAGFSRVLSAGILASIGDLLGVDNPGAAMAAFDRMDPQEVAAAKSWLGASPIYRAALDRLGGPRG